MKVITILAMLLFGGVLALIWCLVLLPEGWRDYLFAAWLSFVLLVGIAGFYVIAREDK